MNTDTRHNVHALVDQLPRIQLPALETILQSMLYPLARKLALTPPDDEPFTEDHRHAVAEADEWSKRNTPVPLETVLADFGLTKGDWETMSKTPLAEEKNKLIG